METNWGIIKTQNGSIELLFSVKFQRTLIRILCLVCSFNYNDKACSVKVIILSGFKYFIFKTKIIITVLIKREVMEVCLIHLFL